MADPDSVLHVPETDCLSTSGFAMCDCSSCGSTHCLLDHPPHSHVREIGDMIHTDQHERSGCIDNIICLRTRSIVIPFIDDSFCLSPDQAYAFICGATSGCFKQYAETKYMKHRFIIPLCVTVHDTSHTYDDIMQFRFNVQYSHAHDGGRINQGTALTRSLVDAQSSVYYPAGRPKKGSDAGDAKMLVVEMEDSNKHRGVVLTVSSTNDPTERRAYSINHRHSSAALDIAVHTVQHRGIHGCSELRGGQYSFECLTGKTPIEYMENKGRDISSARTVIGRDNKELRRLIVDHEEKYKAGARELTSVPVIDLAYGLAFTLTGMRVDLRTLAKNEKQTKQMGLRCWATVTMTFYG